MLTNKQLAILYAAGWKPIIDIGDKLSASIITHTYPTSIKDHKTLIAVQACEIRHVNWLNTDILLEYVVYSVPVWVNFPVYPDDDGY
jgi:hypothetical protein